MSNLFLIFFCVATGQVFSRLKMLPEGAHKSVNAWVLYVALPALSLRYVPQIQFSAHLLLPALAPLVVWGGSWLFVRLYDRHRRLSLASRTALFVVGGLGNTGFIGLPMVTAYFGEENLSYAVIFDQMTFFIFATLGVITVLRANTERAGATNLYAVFKDLLRFPPLIASIVALVLPRFVDFSFVNPFLDKLVATMSPMALFSIGLQLKMGKIRQEWRLLAAGVAYKLVLAPALVLLLAWAMGARGTLAQVSVFEAAMSSHITASILVSQNNLNSNYCSLLVGMGIVLSFATTALWYIAGKAVF